MCCHWDSQCKFQHATYGHQPRSKPHLRSAHQVPTMPILQFLSNVAEKTCFISQSVGQPPNSLNLMCQEPQLTLRNRILRHLKSQEEQQKETDTTGPSHLLLEHVTNVLSYLLSYKTWTSTTSWATTEPRTTSSAMSTK